MVSRSYMLETPPGPSRRARYIHWHATPYAINGLSAAEDRLEDLRVIVRRSPASALACALAAGVLLAHRMRRR